MEKSAIVFVHGHMGRSKQFDRLIPALPESLPADRYNLVLPGHEATLQEFAGKNKDDWQGFVDDSLNQLRSQYEELILVGHSMGGLLLINSAVNCPDKIRSIYAIGLPLFLKITPRGILIRLGTLAKSAKRPSVAVAKEMCGVSGVSLLNSYKLIPNTVGLLRIMKETRKRLSALSVPVTIFNSENDEIVSMRSVLFAQKACSSAEAVTLRRSSHFDYPADEIKVIAEKIRMF